MKHIPTFGEFLNEGIESDVNKYVDSMLISKSDKKRIKSYLSDTKMDPKAKVEDLIAHAVKMLDINWMGLDEAYIGPFQFSDKSSDEELKKLHSAAVDGYANWQKGFEYPKSDYKKAYQEIEKIAKKRDLVLESLNEGMMTINDFSDAFDEFYSFIEDNKGYMDSGTIDEIKKAIHYLDRAWMHESQEHGVKWRPYKIKL